MKSRRGEAAWPEQVAERRSTDEHQPANGLICEKVFAVGEQATGVGRECGEEDT
jgi:hypothetical protein